MQTIGRNYPAARMLGVRDYTELCDYCGAPWHRTDLRLNTDQRLYCPNCQDEAESLKDLADQAANNVGYIEPVRGKTREGP